MEVNRVINGDCLEVIPYLDADFDLILTDPPYNASNSNIGFGEKGYNSVNEDWDKNFTLDFLPMAEENLREGGSMLIFCSYHLLKEYLTKSTLKLQQIIHWAKHNPFPAIAKVYTPNIEYILWFVKEGKPYTFNKKLAGQNILWSNVMNGSEKLGWHPTQKPVSIIENLINVHSKPNDLILDCFSGTGTTAIACINTNREYICIEKDKTYYEQSVKRIKDHTDQQRLFVPNKEIEVVKDVELFNP